jgi:hypothetical protein
MTSSSGVASDLAPRRRQPSVRRVFDETDQRRALSGRPCTAIAGGVVNDEHVEREFSGGLDDRRHAACEVLPRVVVHDDDGEVGPGRGSVRSARHDLQVRAEMRVALSGLETSRSKSLGNMSPRGHRSGWVVSVDRAGRTRRLPISDCRISAPSGPGSVRQRVPQTFA